MKLYTTVASPFGARVRIQVYKKNLPIDIVLPPVEPSSPEFKLINPLQLIPVLDLGDTCIVESEVIQEYLEAKYPQPSLLGDTPESTATIRTLSRITDIYLVSALDPFRSYLRGECQDRETLYEAVKVLHKIYGSLEYFMNNGSYAASNTLSLADCCMAPLFFYLDYFSRKLDIALSLDEFPRLHAWTSAIRKDDAVNKVIEEIEACLQAR